MKTDVVIIGAGMAGLTTGALLAKQGKRVAVIEKGNQPGGRAYCYEEKGFTLNYGAHAVYRPYTGYLAQVMARLERDVPKCDFPDTSRSYWADSHGDRFASLGAKPLEVMTSKLFTIRGKMSLAGIMMAMKGAKTDELPAETTWRQWVESKTGDESVRRFAMALATVNTYQRPGGDLSARMVLGTIQRNAFAKDYVGYMYGGWRSMYEVFVDVIESHGGAVITGAHVQHLETALSRLHGDSSTNPSPTGGEGSYIVAAVTDGERYEADAFVCTLPPQDAPSLARDGTPLASELAGWAGLQDVRALSIDLGFSRPVRDDDATFVFDIDRDLYYSIHSETAKDLAPAGGQMMHAMAYLSPEEGKDGALLAGRKAELVAGLDRFFPGWREAVVVERTLPGVRVLGARSTPDQFVGKRVPLRSSSAANLYFAGDARDLALNLSEIIFASSMEVADAIGASAPVATATAVPIA